MKTDKEFYKLFSADPKRLFELIGIPAQVDYTMKSITLKDFELRMDGFLESDDKNEPVYFVEFQGYPDETIYHRIIKAMAVYGETHPERPIRGMILFTKESLDPKTKPWYNLTQFKDQGFKVYYFDEMLKKLEEKEMHHPLVSVFKPYLIEDQEVLKEESKKWYVALEDGVLNKRVRDIYCTVFIRWMQERFTKLTYEEIFIMLESLTPIEETISYKELVEKGKKEGKKEGEKKGEEKGRNEEKIEIAKKMLLRGDTIPSVMEVTNLSVDEIEKLKVK